MSAGGSESAALTGAHALAEDLSLRAAAADETACLPAEDVDALRRSGLLGLLVPERLGGFGASFSTYARVAIALAAGSGATALVFNMHASVTGGLAATPDATLRSLGVPESYLAARDAILQAAASGCLYCVALSERESESSLSSPRAHYRRDGDGFQLRGEKSFVSGARHADAYLVAARSESSGASSLFLVPRGPGVHVHGQWDTLGMRGTESLDVSFGVDLRPDALVGGREGLALAVAELMPQWLVASYAAVYVGVAQELIRAFAEYGARKQLGNLSAVRARLGRADAVVAAAEHAVVAAAALIDAAPLSRATQVAVYRAKLLAGDAASTAASSLLEAAGAGALRRGERLERLFRDARCGALQPATSDVCADWLGAACLGLDPNRGPERPRW